MPKNNEVSVDALQKALESNPELLKAALNKLGVARQAGRKAYSIIGTEVKKVTTYKMENTKMVTNGTKDVKHYLLRLMNGSTVSVPEHCLDDYGISLTNIPVVDEDGLTQQDKQMAITQGAC